MELYEVVAAEVDVAPDDAKRILDKAIELGAVVGPEELLPGGISCLPLWADLVRIARFRGWRPVVGWPESGDDHHLVLIPATANQQAYEAGRCRWLTVEQFGLVDDTKIVLGFAAAEDSDLMFFTDAEDAFLHAERARVVEATVTDPA